MTFLMSWFFNGDKFKDLMICSKIYVLQLTSFCVFQYGDLPIVTVLLLVISKSICSTMLDDLKNDTDAMSNSS